MIKAGTFNKNIIVFYLILASERRIKIKNRRLLVLTLPLLVPIELTERWQHFSIDRITLNSMKIQSVYQERDCHNFLNKLT